MECFICGKETKKIFKIDVEGNLIEVCENCKSFGKVVFIENLRKNTKTKINKNISIEEFELIENYGDVIRRKREELGLSIEELAKKLGIKGSLLSKIEKCEIYPEEKTIDKIEKILNVKLREKVENIKKKKVRNEKQEKYEKLTIADIVEIK